VNDPSNDSTQNPQPADEIEITEADSVADDLAVQEGTVKCSQCDAAVPEGGGTATENAIFCDSCYGQLLDILEESVADQGQNINYLGAVAGGLLGGAIGAAIWWGFTILTNIQFGLVAVIIGWAAGKGVVLLSGNKRARSLQITAVAITLLSYGMATYWVNRTFIMRYISEQGMEGGLPLFPMPDLFAEIIFLGFEFWDLIFLAIALWQAWKLPMPFVLNKADS